MRTISAREANQGFSNLLQSVAEGEEVLITRRGKPVARLAPVQPTATEPERQAEIDRIIARLREGADLGPPAFWTRDELHDGEGHLRQQRPHLRRQPVRSKAQGTRWPPS